MNQNSYIQNSKSTQCLQTDARSINTAIFVLKHSLKVFSGTSDSLFTCSFFASFACLIFPRRHNHFCGSDGCVIFCWGVPHLLHAVLGYFPHGPNSTCRCACVLLLCMDARVQTTYLSPVPHLNRAIISNR